MIVYIVQELGWEYNDEGLDMTNDTPLKAFVVRSQAEALCQEKELEARRAYEEQARGDWNRLMNIFGGELTTRTEEQQTQWYRDNGLPEPPPIWEGTQYRLGPRPDWE